MKFVLMLLAALPLFGQSLAQEAEALLPKMIEIRRDLHKNPELSNREVRTGKRIAEELTRIGVPFRSGIARNGLVATIEGKSKGPIVAIRADTDALPIRETMDVPYRSINEGVKHACGHDSHVAVALGVTELLWKRRDSMKGTVLVVFQPAEEGPPVGETGGAPMMLAEGIFAKLKPEVMFALHAMPSVEHGSISWTPGSEMASSDRFKITVRGKGTHGATPHLGVDPIVAGAQIVSAMQTIASRNIDPLEPVVVTIGSFHSGTRFNIVPDEAELIGTVRTLNAEVRETTKRRMQEIAERVAASSGATAVVEFDLGIPVLRNDEKIGAWGEAVLQRELGAAKVIRQPARMIAEDFAFFADLIPSFYFFLGVGNKEKGITAALHTAEFDIDERAMVTGVRAISRLVLDYQSGR